jgi:hypothetical protein
MGFREPRLMALLLAQLGRTKPGSRRSFRPDYLLSLQGMLFSGSVAGSGELNL